MENYSHCVAGQISEGEALRMDKFIEAFVRFIEAFGLYDNCEVLPKAPVVFRLVLTHALTDRNSSDEWTLLIPEEVYPTETENKKLILFGYIHTVFS